MRHALNRGFVMVALSALLASPAAVLASAEALVLQTGPSVITDREFLAAGFASAGLSRGGTSSDGTGSFSYVGSAYASTRGGSLGVAVTATGAGYQQASDRVVVRAAADFDELVTFSHSGLVTFRLAVQGSFASIARGQMTSFAELFVAGAGTTLARTSWFGGSSTFSLNTHLHAHDTTLVSTLPSNYIVWLERTTFVTAGIAQPLSGHLEVSVAPPVTGTASALFDQTAQLSIFVPEGVTFTSQSGDFLADASPIPEPAMAWLLLPGLLLLGTRVRRKG